MSLRPRREASGLVDASEMASTVSGQPMCRDSIYVIALTIAMTPADASTWLHTKVGALSHVVSVLLTALESALMRRADVATMKSPSKKIACTSGGVGQHKL